MSGVSKKLMSASGAAGGGLETAIEEVFSTYLYTGNGDELVTPTTGRKNIIPEFQISDRIVVDGFSNDTNLEAIFTTPGTYTWTCPAGVTSVCVVAVGGGAGNAGGGDANSAGGGLGWKNNIPVTPGSTYTVKVGAGGPGGFIASGANAGGDSFFIDITTVAGLGAPGYPNPASGGFVGDGGGNGGKSTYATGGGAGGYLGDGGFGRAHQQAANQHGRGGAGGAPATFNAGTDGGGVGIYGAGVSGTTGAGSVGNGAPTTAYGFGGGNSRPGGGGAVRIIWGSGRSFPFKAGYQSRQIEGSDCLVWLKSRQSSSRNHYLEHSNNGFFQGGLFSNNTNAASFATRYLNALSTGGVDIMHSTTTAENQNQQNENYTSWTFRKAPRFFDVVTYTGDGSGTRLIPHELGVEPGAIFFKRINSTSNWRVYHRFSNSVSLRLNTSETRYNNLAGLWSNTDSVFEVFTGENSSLDDTNIAGATYVAYLFAHDPLGPSEDGSDGLIACGSYTGTGGTVEINLGWEPQWLLVKRSQSGAVPDWHIYDNMRGIPTGGIDQYLRPNNTEPEVIVVDNVDLTPTGFKANSNISLAGETYIYIAIRRGPMRAPESGTEVFAPKVVVGDRTGNHVISGLGFAPDFVFGNGRGGDVVTYDKLRGANRSINTNDTSAETNDTSLAAFLNDGYLIGSNGGRFYDDGTGSITWSFRRAPEFFDVVAYTGTGSPLTLNHNLSVAPELVLYKCRNAAEFWLAQSSSLTSVTNSYILLNSSGAQATAGSAVFRTPDETTFGLDGGVTGVNTSGNTYIAYLFATLPGVSKVGSYTGNGSSQTINCGFTTGARFILIKRTDNTGDWYVWDTARGIVAANDPHLSLNTTAAEVTTNDSIDPASSGFIVNQVAATNINVSAASYIFYAVA